MSFDSSLFSYNEADELEKIKKLQQLLIRSALINFFIVALIGLLLRSFPFLSSFPLMYKNILHGHSHFAFGGWVMPALLGLLIKCFPQVQQRIAYKHWRNISYLLLLSAYGMLVAFPLQGYKAVSITFSTLSIGASFYLAVVVWKVLPALKQKPSLLFLKGGLFYLILSSLGPFATAPLIAMGKMGTPVYFDAIYFYLHFQYNGWFVFAVLALFYKCLEERDVETKGKKVFWLLHSACIPTYFLSILWHQPSIVFNMIGGIGASLQCIALIYLLRDVGQLKLSDRLVQAMFHLSFICLTVKIILQFFGAWPSIAVLAYHQRNFVIAYLHLVLLGGISLFLIAWMIRAFEIYNARILRMSVGLFIVAFITTELLLVAWPISGIMHHPLSHYSLLLFLFSVLLPVSIGLLAFYFLDKQFIKNKDAVLSIQ